ncbi:hypothetical protein [Nocardia sp. NPDC019304]|uniref:hypothetical protein n=1 Tax=unclassified Nocardia TaxID=2637762 RepID=UPI0033DC2D54
MVTNSPQSPVHIVVTCTNRKRIAVPEQLTLGSISAVTPRDRFSTWTRRLSEEPPTIPAEDLYCGDHWNIARSLPNLIGEQASLWVCSAGYGLVPVDTCLNPYMATFSAGSRDSVGRDRATTADWWRRLSDWAGPHPDQPRSFAGLARRDPDATIVAVLSNPYLYACADDLRSAAASLNSIDKFIVIGANRATPELEDVVIPIPATLRSVVGGSLHALQVRAATHLLPLAMAEPAGIGRKVLRELAQQVVAAAPPDPSRRAPGVRMGDDEVRQFIILHRVAPAVSATRLLRKLRDSGFSCEQGRFKKLYHETMAEVAA